jgi:multidrug efflux system membrane fusion protein
VRTSSAPWARSSALPTAIARAAATAALVVLALGGVLAGCRREQKTATPPIRPVRVAAVETTTVRDGMPYSASIRPATQVELAFKVAGYVDRIHQVAGMDGRSRIVQEGDPVTKDTVLAHVRVDDYEARLGQARAQLGEAQAAQETAGFQLTAARTGLAQARLDLNRAQALLDTKSLTRADYDATRTRHDEASARVDAAAAQVELARARVQGARAQIREAELTVGDTSLRSPMDAIVIKRRIEVGSFVGAGAVGFVLADVRSVKAVFGVPDLVVASLRLGQALALTTAALPDETFNGRITAIAPSADPASRVFDIEVTIDNARGRLRPGMIGAVIVGGGASSRAQTVLPLSAVVRPSAGAEGYAVFVVEEQGGRQMARLRRVKLGDAIANRIAVTEGVRTGERVIVAGAALTTDGEPVQIVP